MNNHTLSTRSTSSPWIVAKFGGTSVSTRERWLSIEKIAQSHVSSGKRVLLVCSALSTVTNRLERLGQLVGEGKHWTDAWHDLAALHQRLAVALDVDHASTLGSDLTDLHDWLSHAEGPLTPRQVAHLLSHGELLSTKLGAAFLAKRGASVSRVDSRELLSSIPSGDDGSRFLSASCEAATSPQARERLNAETSKIVVTQGFIARDPSGETVLLGRGGSDASAAYLAAAVDAAAVEIWSDVAGLYTADPRVCASARMLRRTSYAEAEALSALGVKALHPRSIQPLRERGIPLTLGATERPDLRGTRVTGAHARRGVKYVTSRQGLALVVMSRPASYQPVGFLSAVSSRFERHAISMDLVSCSPSEIRATIDLAAFPSLDSSLDRLLADLAQVCRPRVLRGLGSVSLVGTHLPALGMADREWISVLAGVYVHLTAQSANGTHLTFIVDECEVPDLLMAGHEAVVASLPARETMRLEPPGQRSHTVDPAMHAPHDEAAA